MLRYFFVISGLPDNVGFRMFGPGHLAWLAAISAAAVVCSLWYRRLSPRGRKAAGYAFCWSMVALDLLKDVYFIVSGVFSYEFLPLHLCGMAIYISLLNAYWPGRIKQELLYSLCMPGAVMALVFPAWTFYPLWNIATLQCFLIHALLFLYPVMLVAGGDLRPSVRNLPYCLLFLLAACPAVALVNRALGTNFMFISSAPSAQPFLLFVSWFGTPGYIFGMFLLLLAVWVVLYVPVLAVRLHERKTAGRREKKVLRRSCGRAGK